MLCPRVCSLRCLSGPEVRGSLIEISAPYWASLLNNDKAYLYALPSALLVTLCQFLAVIPGLLIF
jgi:hypothetical protein